MTAWYHSKDYGVLPPEGELVWALVDYPSKRPYLVKGRTEARDGLLMFVVLQLPNGEESEGGGFPLMTAKDIEGRVVSWRPVGD